jgi:polyisoprenoid-binding protein YceI
MRTSVAIVLILVAFGLGVGAGILGILWATGSIAEPSRDADEVAPTLSLDSEPTQPPAESGALSTQIADLGTRIDGIATQVAALDANVAAGATAAAIEPTPVPTEEATPEPAADVPERALYRIITEESEARFQIEEILLGNPTTVIGTTPNVGGDVIVNFTDPAASQVGEIVINARTFRTDQEFRDQSIRGQILQSSRDEFEFITFVPTTLEGLPDGPVAVGDTLEFAVTGDLTIRDVTRSVVFETSVTVAADDRIEGLATTQILYADFDITINAPPQVGGVADEVILEIDFVAEKVDEE